MSTSTPPDIVQLAFHVAESEPSPYTRFARKVLTVRTGARSAVEIREGVDDAIAAFARELNEPEGGSGAPTSPAEPTPATAEA